MTTKLIEIITKIRHTIQCATDGLIGREQLAELMILAAVAHEHLLVIGPPGTAKSAVVRRVSQTIGGTYFEYLLGRFTEPSELFGAVDLKKLREGVVETDVTGMLPEADIVFLDEVFLGSTAILNTLLGILNERRFKRGHTDLLCQLKVCVGAANSLPEDESLAAFSDRFLIHLFIESIPDHQLEAMLAGGWQSENSRIEALIDAQQLDDLHQLMKQVCLDEVRPKLATAVRSLRHEGIHLSDRRIVKAQRLIAAAALLSGRMTATDADLWPLLYVLPTHEMQLRGKDILHEQFAISANDFLFTVVEEAALQPLSRVSRLIEQAQVILADNESTKQNVETLLREIDANFSQETIPLELAELRTQLALKLSHLI